MGGRRGPRGRTAAGGPGPGEGGPRTVGPVQDQGPGVRKAKGSGRLLHRFLGVES